MTKEIVGSYFELMAEVTLADIAAIGLCCRSSDCCDIAEFTVYWPGQPPLPQCLVHLAKLSRVATIMGFALQSTPLPVKRNEPNAPSDLELRVRELEMT